MGLLSRTRLAPLPAGLTAAGVREDFSTTAPVSLYGATKLASEQLALEYGLTYGFPVWINRCGVLAGAGQFGRPDQGIFSFWINSWLRRRPLGYTGFGGLGYQVRDCLHPADLVPLLERQIALVNDNRPRVANVGGGQASAISLCQLSEWCRERLGDHTVTSQPEARLFDLPWVVLDASLATEAWDWKPSRRTSDILEEIVQACGAASRMVGPCGLMLSMSDRTRPNVAGADKAFHRDSSARRGGLHCIHSRAPSRGATAVWCPTRNHRCGRWQHRSNMGDPWGFEFCGFLRSGRSRTEIRMASAER